MNPTTKKMQAKSKIRGSINFPKPIILKGTGHKITIRHVNAMTKIMKMITIAIRTIGLGGFSSSILLLYITISLFLAFGQEIALFSVLY